MRRGRDAEREQLEQSGAIPEPPAHARQAREKRDLKKLPAEAEKQDEEARSKEHQRTSPRR
jgi:ribosome maturation factor RimP